jgi:hypothetical protein
LINALMTHAAPCILLTLDVRCTQDRLRQKKIKRTQLINTRSDQMKVITKTTEELATVRRLRLGLLGLLRSVSCCVGRSRCRRRRRCRRASAWSEPSSSSPPLLRPCQFVFVLARHNINRPPRSCCRCCCRRCRRRRCCCCSCSCRCRPSASSRQARKEAIDLVAIFMRRRVNAENEKDPCVGSALSHCLSFPPSLSLCLSLFPSLFLPLRLPLALPSLSLSLSLWVLESLSCSLNGRCSIP